MYNLCRVFKTDISAVLTVKSGLDPHMINILKMDLNYFLVILVALLSTNHKCTHPCLLLLSRRRCVKLLKMLLSARPTLPPSRLVVEYGVFVSKIRRKL